MTITIAELENFKNSVVFLNQLRSMPLEVIEFHLENEYGYIIDKSSSIAKKTAAIQTDHSIDGEMAQGCGQSFEQHREAK
ncbi:MAG: hypothetical protein IPM89_05235 [Candidatus Competibacteraceae bacterium]|nr:MAG: hypothetical protein IPM89_05235 [Candidatus Competibacteraceae bacterium]